MTKPVSDTQTNFSHQPGSACLIDVLTLENGFDLLARTEPSDLLLPIKLVSLGQIIEAIICYDQIMVDQFNAHVWLGSVGGTYSDFMTLVSYIDPQGIERSTLHDFAAQKMLSLARSNTFQAFVDRVVRACPEGTVFALARHYHGLQTRELASMLASDSVASADTLVSQASSQWFCEGDEAISQLIAALGSGAFYYRVLSALGKIPYSPFCLRAPICAYEDARCGSPPTDAARIALELLAGEAANATKVSFGPAASGFLDLDIPLVFAYVLSQAEDRNDILASAFRLRNSVQAKRLRDQISTLTKALTRGNIEESALLIAKLRREAKHFLTTDSSQSSFKLKIGFGGVGTEIPLSAPAIMRRLLKRAHRSTFYHLLASELPTLWRLNRDVYRLFGLQLNRDHWSVTQRSRL